MVGPVFRKIMTLDGIVLKPNGYMSLHNWGLRFEFNVDF